MVLVEQSATKKTALRLGLVVIPSRRPALITERQYVNCILHVPHSK